MLDPESWQRVTVTARTAWADGLWTDTFDVTPDFRAGQFCTLAAEVDGEVVKRAYSIGSAPGQPLELFIVRVEGGKLTPVLWDLEPGATVWMRRKIAGLFTLDRVPEGGALWMVCTGTGLAPYISMLRHGEVFDRHDHVVVVHGVRTADQLAYAEELTVLQEGGRVTYLPYVSRERVDGLGHGRVTAALLDGGLETVAGREVTSDDHVMLCGNPAMVTEMMKLLREHRGLALHRPRHPGQIHLERYW